MLPLVYRQLKSRRGRRARVASSDAFGVLRQCAQQPASRSRARAGGRDCFSARSIETIAFKGPVLALQAWDDLALRQFNDLDLLVHPSDAARAVEILIADGYTALTFDRQHPELSIARRCEDEFMRPGSAAMIDLHWELNPSYFAYGPMGSEVWARSESRRVEGVEVKTLGPTDLVLFLAVHATKHGWINLGWICDFYAALRALPEGAMPEIAEVASPFGMFADVAARDCAGGRSPRSADSAAVRRSDSLRRRGRGTGRGNRAPAVCECRHARAARIPNGRCRFAAITSMRDRARFIASRAFTPNIDDFNFIALPPLLHPLYYATRPLRLAWQQSRRLFVDVPHPLKRLPGAPR